MLSPFFTTPPTRESIHSVAKAPSRRPESGITALEIAGFKSAVDPVRIELGKLTILAGQNSAGKSTIFQPFLMLKQTVEKPFDGGCLSLDGPMVNFTSTQQFMSRRVHGNGKLFHTFAMKLERGKDFIEFNYTDAGGTGITLENMSFKADGVITKWKEGQTLDPSGGGVPNEVNFMLTHMQETVEKLNVDRKRKISPISPEIIISRERAALTAELRQQRSGNKPVFIFGISPATDYMREIRRIIYLPGLRGNPGRNYAISSPQKEFAGNFNDYVAGIIYHWQNTKDERLERLGDNLKSLGLTSKVVSKKIDDTKVELRVARLPAAARGGTRDTVSIADVGIGVSQTLPVLVALLIAEKNQLVMIEQPEIHLHPRAQIALAPLLLDAINRGARVVVETHSSLLLLALQTLVAKKKIHPNDLSLNWFTRSLKGQTLITRAAIGPDGSYGDWPVDFDDVDLASQDEYLSAVDASLGSD